MTELADKRCAPCEGGTEPLDADAAARLLEQLSSQWSLDSGAKAITGEFDFKNYYRTTAFVNAVAWVSHREDHHPDIEFGYKKCRIHYTTHAIGGLSDNDFICAAKVDRLLDA